MKIVSERALRRRAVGWSNRFSALRRLVVGLVVAFLSGVMTPAAALASPPLTTYDPVVHVFDTIPPVDRLDVSVVLAGRAPPVHADPASARPHVRHSHFGVAANTGGDILRPLSRVEASTLDDALRPAKLDHVFVPKHNFDPLVTKYGTREDAMEQIVRSLNGPDLPGVGRFEVNRVVGGQDVVIRGAVVDGVPRIGTAFTP